jgi:hypothetical protein
VGLGKHWYWVACTVWLSRKEELREEKQRAME